MAGVLLAGPAASEEVVQADSNYGRPAKRQNPSLGAEDEADRERGSRQIVEAEQGQACYFGHTVDGDCSGEYSQHASARKPWAAWDSRGDRWLTETPTVSSFKS